MKSRSQLHPALIGTVLLALSSCEQAKTEAAETLINEAVSFVSYDFSDFSLVAKQPTEIDSLLSEAQALVHAKLSKASEESRRDDDSGLPLFEFDRVVAQCSAWVDSLSQADRANGISWNGRIRVDYIVRSGPEFDVSLARDFERLRSGDVHREWSDWRDKVHIVQAIRRHNEWHLTVLRKKFGSFEQCEPGER